MKKHTVFVLFMVIAGLFAFGCQKKIVTQPEPPVTERPAVSKPAPDRGPERITEDKVDSKVESVESRDITSQQMQQKEGLFEDVLFDYDKYDVRDEYQQTLKSIAASMSKNTGSRLAIEGHTDERGTNEYNLALGDRRAKAVKDYLVSLGVASARIETISYGEEKPACTAQTEECWAKNRRAHFIVLERAGK